MSKLFEKIKYYLLEISLVLMFFIILLFIFLTIININRSEKQNLIKISNGNYFDLVIEVGKDYNLLDYDIIEGNGTKNIIIKYKEKIND